MAKRILETNASDFRGMGKTELLESIRLAEGRTVCAEVVCTVQPLIDGVTNAELAAAFGADMITLNFYDVLHPVVMGLAASEDATHPRAALHVIKALVGRPVGVNLEPVPPERVSEEYRGRVAIVDNARRAVELGADYLVLTGNPGTGVSMATIAEAAAEISAAVGDRVMVVGGKMHGAGLGAGDIVSGQAVHAFAAAGVDVILVPAPGTTPGATLDAVRELVGLAHAAGKLAMSAIGTSQEGADEATVRHIALLSKMAGADIVHIGDAGYSGVANPENILALSLAIRGRRHTYRRMAASIVR